MTLRQAVWTLAALSAAGLGISLYLARMYLTGESPVCFGDSGCAAVQASPYAWIGGIPLPVLGALHYAALAALALLVLWGRWRPDLLLQALFGVTLAGVIFSAYLTWLELFVIGAICYWCVASAAVMVLVFLFSLVALHRYARGR